MPGFHYCINMSEADRNVIILILALSLKQMRKLFFYLILNILLFKPFILFSQQFKISDSLNYSSVYKNIIHSYSKIGMKNDYNPILNKHCDDEGNTLELFMFTRIKNRKSYNYFDIEYRSGLCTRYLREDQYKIGNRTIYPQYFVEISYLNFHYQYFLKRYNCFLSVGGGAGINNKSKPIWGLSLYMQGGDDGLGGYHDLLDNNPGQENISTGKVQPFFFLSLSIIKHYSIVSTDTIKNKPFLEIQSGLRLGTDLLGSNIFFKSEFDIPLVQFHYQRFNLFMLSLIMQNEITLCRDGFLSLPELGTEIRLSFLTVGFTSIFILGHQNISVLKYVDNDILMRGYLTINF